MDKEKVHWKPKKMWLPIGVYRTFPLPILPVPPPIVNNYISKRTLPAK